jgi:hypothetical protein
MKVVHIKDLPRILCVLLDTRAWEEREVAGRIIRHKRFIDFITIPPIEGCGWPPGKVEALIKDDAETLARWREATTGKQGAHGSNRTVKPVRGTTLAYTLNRLKRERPDLFERVVAREMSANAAAIEAGWRKQSTPFERMENLAPKLSDLEWERFKQREDQRRQPNGRTVSV